MSRHELVIFENGTASVRPEDSTEAMHSSIGAWEEANTLYVGQSGLMERLMTQEPAPLVLYDVGMGIAANAPAAIACWRKVNGRPLQIVSFENQTDGLRLALKHSERFPFFDVPMLECLLAHGRYIEPGLVWELREGDFVRVNLAHEPEPEVVFWDFYSPGSADNALWGYTSFARIWAACAKRRDSGQTVTLTTYSSATAVRAAMLLAGFQVGVGAATSAKRETTVASTRCQELARPLDHRWLMKFERSDKPLPADWCNDVARVHVRQASQFSK
jgi:queuine tRNA-ribosyltransferase